MLEGKKAGKCVKGREKGMDDRLVRKASLRRCLSEQIPEWRELCEQWRKAVCAEGKSKDFDMTENSKEAGGAGLKIRSKVGKEVREAGSGQAT